MLFSKSVHLLDVMVILEIPFQVEANDALKHISIRIQQYFRHYGMKHITGISPNPTGQAIVERSNRTLKEMLNKQKGITKTQR